MSAANPVSPKVLAAAAGAGAGAAVSTAALWALGAGVWGAGWGADQVDNALAAVPTPLSGLVLLVVTIVGAALPGYRATDPERIPSADSSDLVAELEKRGEGA